MSKTWGRSFDVANLSHQTYSPQNSGLFKAIKLVSMITFLSYFHLNNVWNQSCYQHHSNAAANRLVVTARKFVNKGTFSCCTTKFYEVKVEEMKAISWESLYFELDCVFVPSPWTFPGEDSRMWRTGMLVGKFQLSPKRRPIKRYFTTKNNTCI